MTCHDKLFHPQGFCQHPLQHRHVFFTFAQLSYFSMRNLLNPLRALLRPQLSQKYLFRMGNLTVPNRDIWTLSKHSHLAISEAEDDPEIRTKYRPFLLESEVESSDWISKLELETAFKIAEKNLAETGSRLKILVLYGSLRKR